MQKVNLYRYENADSSITVTPIQQKATDRVHAVRLIADEEKILTNGEIETPCVDVMPSEIEGWWEIDNPNPPDETEEPETR